jgi:HlyD family secretion protein
MLAALGLGIGLAIVIVGTRPAPKQVPTLEPASAPFASFVAGAGLVEASTGNIAIGSPVAGIATEIYVRVGDRISADDALFKIDDRDLRAQLITAVARVKSAEASILQPQHRLDYLESLVDRDPEAVSAQDLSDLHDQLAMAEAEIGLANAQVAQLNLDIQRRTVRAPIAGRVLKLEMRLGEYVDGMTPLLLLGDDRELYVRVNVDESEAWRVLPSASAIAYMRGNPQLQIPLKFQYIEPYVIPKTSLTGRSIERADTRVLQVLYSFSSDQMPIYIGQQLDVFIEAPPIAP